MSHYHAALALDYFQARARTERTQKTLGEIVQHLTATYALPAEEAEATHEEARALATQRGLLATYDPHQIIDLNTNTMRMCSGCAQCQVPSGQRERY